MHLKNVLNFFGIWSYPLGLAASGMAAYLLQAMGIYELTLDMENITSIAIGGLIAPLFVTATNIHDYLSKGRTDFTLNFTNKKDVTTNADGYQWS